MAPPPIIEDQSHSSHRAKVRIGVAAVLLITAIGILTVLNQRKAEAPEPEQKTEPPAAQTSISSAEAEAPLAAPTDATPPAAPPPVAEEPAAAVPPPPPVPGKLPEAPTKKTIAPTAPTLEEESAGATRATAVPQPVAHPSPVPAQPAALRTAAQPPAPPAAPSAALAAPKAFEVQLGVFSDPDNAKQLQAMLAQHGIPSHMETRVQIGPFKTREEADRAREKLKTLGIPAVIVGK